jgi:hypothetical protein
MLFILLLLSGVVSNSAQVKEYPLYRQINNDKVFMEQFNKYMELMSTGSPDGKKVYGLMQMPEKTLDMMSTIFHEQVELMEWMNLKHKYEDIMTIEYYQKHYMEVYPVAHRKAVIEEIAFIKYYAMKKNYPNIPEVAYNLVSPLIEYYGVAVERMQKRLQFNLEYLAQVKYVTRKDLETAIKVYEDGGYKYKDKNRLVSESLELIKKQWQ